MYIYIYTYIYIHTYPTSRRENPGSSDSGTSLYLRELSPLRDENLHGSSPQFLPILSLRTVICLTSFMLSSFGSVFLGSCRYFGDFTLIVITIMIVIILLIIIIVIAIVIVIVIVHRSSNKHNNYVSD